jgi:two-component system, NtrC family, nitrogen regulation sensor histidine kinase GlnL
MKLRALDDHLPFASLNITEQGVIAGHNAIAARLFGELTGKHIHALLHLCPDMLRYIDDALRFGATLKAYDYPLMLDQLTLRCNIFLITSDEHSGITIWLDILSGMEEMQRRTEQQHVAKRAGLLAAMLAHEINNPLSAIRGAAQLLEEEHPDDALTKLIIRESDRIHATLQHVEFLHTHHDFTPEAHNIHEILRDARHSLNPQLTSHIHIEERFDPSLPLVATHRTSLTQLFINLMKNAVEAMQSQPDGGTLTITTTCPHDLRLRRDGKRILPIAITLHDTGEGIPAEHHATLFDPYMTTKGGGKGLGLSIASKIVSDHHGTIELLHSERGNTSFRVILPAYE